MYNVNITGSFSGVFPNIISISSRSHASAVRLYKSVFQARQLTTGNQVILQSAFGFKVRIDVSSHYPNTSTVRLALPSTISREAVARALCKNSLKPRSSRSGIVVTDAFGVKWTLA